MSDKNSNGLSSFVLNLDYFYERLEVDACDKFILYIYNYTYIYIYIYILVSSYFVSPN